MFYNSHCLENLIFKNIPIIVFSCQVTKKGFMLFKVLLTQKHFCLLRKYRLHMKIYYSYILLSTSYYDAHRREVAYKEMC